MQDLSIMNLSKRNKNIILLIIDVSIIILSYFIAIILNNNIDNISLNLSITLPIAVVIYISFLKLCRMYSCIWVNAGAYEIMQSIVAVGSGCIVSTILMLFIPNTVLALTNLIAGILIMVCITGVRLSLRIVTRFITYSMADKTTGKYNVLIIGAGDCASAIISEIRKEKSEQYNIIGIIDDNKAKLNSFLNGVKVLGSRENIKEVNHMEKEDVNKGDKILIFKQNLSIL